MSLPPLPPSLREESVIGVFDSGIGGLTLLKPLAEAYPSENFIYIGDTARLPYGSKSAHTIRVYAEQILDHLASHPKMRAIVVACNSASTQVPEKSWKGIPVFNVIDPGVQLALKNSESQRIGLIATRATVQSEAYAKRLLQQAPKAQIFSAACPLLVPLAEEGWVDDPITNLVVYRYVQPLLQHQIDTLIMGCTHYPILESSIRRAVGPHVHLIHSGEAMVEALRPALQPSPASAPRGQIHVLATDFSEAIQVQTERLLQPLKPIFSAET